MAAHAEHGIGQFAELLQLVVGHLQQPVPGLVAVVMIDPGQVGQVYQHQSQMRLIGPGIIDGFTQLPDKLLALYPGQRIQVRSALKA